MKIYKWGNWVTVGVMILVWAGPAAALHDSAEQVYDLVNGVTAPIYDYAAAIRESVLVQVPDLDGCGGPVQVAADIIRPRELDGTAKVPAIMVASPYYLCCGRGKTLEFVSKAHGVELARLLAELQQAVVKP